MSYFGRVAVATERATWNPVWFGFLCFNPPPTPGNTGSVWGRAEKRHTNRGAAAEEAKGVTPYNKKPYSHREKMKVKFLFSDTNAASLPLKSFKLLNLPASQAGNHGCQTAPSDCSKQSGCMCVCGGGRIY